MLAQIESYRKYFIICINIRETSPHDSCESEHVSYAVFLVILQQNNDVLLFMI